jgi:hypothetical protein
LRQFRLHAPFLANPLYHLALRRACSGCRSGIDRDEELSGSAARFALTAPE